MSYTLYLLVVSFNALFTVSSVFCSVTVTEDRIVLLGTTAVVVSSFIPVVVSSFVTVSIVGFACCIRISSLCSVPSVDL